MAELSMLQPLVMFLFAIGLLRLLAFVTGGLRIDSWVSAGLTVLIIHVVGWGASRAFTAFGAAAMPSFDAAMDAMLMGAGISFAINLVGLVVAALIMSSIEIKSFIGLLFIALGLTALGFAPMLFTMLDHGPWALK